MVLHEGVQQLKEKELSKCLMSQRMQNITEVSTTHKGFFYLFHSVTKANNVSLGTACLVFLNFVHFNNIVCVKLLNIHQLFEFVEPDTLHTSSNPSLLTNVPNNCVVPDFISSTMWRKHICLTSSFYFVTLLLLEISLTYFLAVSISLKSCKYFLNKEISKDKQIKSAEC